MQTGTPNSKKPSTSSPEGRPAQRRHPRRNNRRGSGKRNYAERPTSIRREISAGGIIFRCKNGKLEFFFIRDPFGKWTFPKGHQKLGETLAETAVREIEEETGLKGLKYISPLGRTSFRFRREKTLIEKVVYLFLFEGHPTIEANLPGVEGILKCAWFPGDIASNVSGYRNLDLLMSKALRIAKTECREQRDRKRNP